MRELKTPKKMVPRGEKKKRAKRVPVTREDTRPSLSLGGRPGSWGPLYMERDVVDVVW
eukprot:CAMPEP_0118642412 /NCGR_PEP_ID=MMETSP0785-20121206/5820_1 /TAXON_ID=91992 /ORGANISM="Bolidomonas pacifica, Strain CCMP 1866" /LENGTH=57 /DNA_ID=CAMNT_0006533959 /DNA_START=364 /DNA_END=534 /DNA_ORIENTATION=+